MLRSRKIQQSERSKIMKRAFTLIEVNLAMLIMAGGILSVVGLYSFGFRENRQSIEDVKAMTMADTVISPLVMAISATNVKWSTFNSLKNNPKNAWGSYIDDNGVVNGNPQAIAASVFNSTLSHFSEANVPGDFPSDMICGLVVQHDDDSAIVRISFRATRHKGELLAMPIFYTEVRFQGLPDE